MVSSREPVLRDKKWQVALDKKSWVLRRVCDWLYLSLDMAIVVVFLIIILASWTLLTARRAKLYLYLSWIQCSRFIDFIEFISLWWTEWLNELFWELMTDKSSRRKSLVVNSAQGLKLISLFLSNNYYFNNANIYTGYLSVLLKRTVIKRVL